MVYFPSGFHEDDRASDQVRVPADAHADALHVPGPAHRHRPPPMLYSTSSPMTLPLARNPWCRE
jgi:hypothetical protein